VIDEDGSELASELWATTHPGISSILAYPEGRAALAAARRGARLAAAAHTHALEDFESLHGELSLIGIDVRLAREAGELAEQSPCAATTQFISPAHCQPVRRSRSSAGTTTSDAPPRATDARSPHPRSRQPLPDDYERGLRGRCSIWMFLPDKPASARARPQPAFP
jgi:hypothetical protein